MNRRTFLLRAIGAAALNCTVGRRPVRAQTTADTKPQSESLHVLRLDGSPRERGRRHGETLRDKIQTLLEAWKGLLAQETGGAVDALIKEFIAETRFMDAASRWTPDILEELRGTAEAANVDFDTLFTFNCTDEHEWYLRYKGLGLALPEGRGCSSLGACGDDGKAPVIAQNLDIPSGSEGFEILLRISPNGSAPETYIFTVAGMVGIVGLNSAPVGVCNNALSMLNARLDGLPVNFVVRGLLAQQSYQDAVQFLLEVNHASGQNYLLGGPVETAMFECSANEVARVTLPGYQRRQLHTNHPLVSKDINAHPAFMQSQSTSDTNVRLASLAERLGSETGARVTVDLLKATLSAHDDPANPVCRHHAADPGRNFTAACLICELTAPPVLHIAPGPPCKTAFTTYQFA